MGFAPAGDWVLMEPFERPKDAPADSIDAGRRFWLSDSQVDLRGGERAWMGRVITEVVSGDGLQPTAQISVDFEPSYEQLDIHHIRVIRDGVARELDVRNLINVFRRERDLERAMYDGRLTAHVVAPDVRVGDIVDYAYTVRGAHPSLRGLFACEVSFQWSCWVGQTRVRLLADPARQLVTRVWGRSPTEHKSVRPDGSVERLWSMQDQKGFKTEAEVPGWVRYGDSLRIADAIAWSNVSDLFAKGYASPEVLPEDLELEAVRLETDHPTLAARAAEAVRLVQHALRYHSVSLGDGGFVPRPVERIWAARAGDCKDSSRLLVALLRRLGVEADPALVNTGNGATLDRDAPNAASFNHCIVRVRLDGETYWFDPTRYRQGGALANMAQARYGWALALVPDARLESMGEDTPTPVCDVKEAFVLGASPNDPAEMSVETAYRGWRADDIRRRLESEGVSAVSQGYCDYYSRNFGLTTELEPLRIEDDVQANVLKIWERYTLAGAWEIDKTHARFATVDDLFASHLTPQRSVPRRHPIDLGTPRALSVETLIETYNPVPITPWDDVFEIPGVRATSRFEKRDDSGRRFRLVRGLTVSRRELEVGEAPAFFDLREGALKSAGVTINEPIQAPQPKVAGIDRRLVFLVAWIVVIVLLQLLARNF